jgi:hypothetical protein
MTDRDWIEICLSGGELDDAAHAPSPFTSAASESKRSPM